RLLEATRPVAHHVANHAPHPPAGISVVADVGHAVGGQVLPADAKQVVLDRVGYPGIDSVGNDVIEDAEILVDVENVFVLQAHVVELQRLDRAPAQADLDRGEIDADKLAAGQLLGHGNQIAAGAAAQFQHAAILD